MTNIRNLTESRGDLIRFGVITTLRSGVAAAILFGLDWTEAQTAAGLLFASNAIDLAFLIFKKGQSAG